MSWVYRKLVRPVLFEFDSEEIHNLTVDALARVSRNETLCEMLSTFFSTESLPIELFGLNFSNPIGLAAGMDKHARALPVWKALGFGFSELGGVTRTAQAGNPPPRLFRIPSQNALINRMGFNNPGADAIAGKLEDWQLLGRWPAHPVGINLGKSKTTPLESAAAEYAFTFDRLWDYADFFVVNVSSPNTPNLRQLQDRSALDEILSAIQSINSKKRVIKPILVKVAPDLTFDALDDILELIEPRNVAGIVATNTTIARPALATEDTAAVYAEIGGLSGKPLQARSTEVIRHLYRQSSGKIPLIGSGGIFTAEDAWEKLTAGASLLQIYTGLIYQGPSIVKEIVRGLRRKLSQNGLRHISEAIGAQALNS